MKSVSQLSAWRDDARNKLTAAQRVRDQFQRELQALEADRPNRSSDFMQTAVRALRDHYLTETGKPVADVQQLAKSAQADLSFWRSTLFVMSRERFDKESDANDNAARARHLAELSAMPAPMRAMVFEHAKAERNLPLLYQCWLANEARTDQSNWKALDLRGVEVPVQQQALAVIADAIAVNGQAENLMGEISGRRTGNPLTGARAATHQLIEPSLSFDLPRPLPTLDPVATADMPPGTPQERITALRQAA